MHLVQKAMETAASDSGQDPPVILFFRYRFFVLLLWMFARLHITAPLQKKCPRGSFLLHDHLGFLQTVLHHFFCEYLLFLGANVHSKAVMKLRHPMPS